MARWENTDLWDGKGNYLGRGTTKPAPIMSREDHICRFPHTCGTFICPSCKQAVAWCRGASDGPQCTTCWDLRAYRRMGPGGLELPLLLAATLLVFVILLVGPP